MNIADLTSISHSFSQTLTLASQGEKTSLPFIRHTLSTQKIVPDGQVFQTLVIGGSFYQKALMKQENGRIQIIKHSHGPQPAFLHKDTLMSFIANHIDKNIKVLALNFAYPLEPVVRNGMVDGRLQSGSKENTFEGLLGNVVGESVEHYFQDNHQREIKVSSANDTICLLLSGLVDHRWDELAAGIVGTGLNFALFLDYNTVVNLESAEFTGFKQSEAGKAVDAASASPGRALIEKEVSGAYLYKYFNYMVEQKGISCKPIASTKELDDLTKSADAKTAAMAQSVIEHSASLVAAQIAGILQFQKRDLTFIMQGSLFWKGRNYQELVTKQVQQLAPEYAATFKQVENSDLLGAAKLVV